MSKALIQFFILYFYLGKRAKLLVFFAWALSAIFSIPLFILYEETVIQGVTQCWIELGDQWRWQVYMVLVSTVLFFIPAVIITMCYAIIVKTIWDKGTYKMPKDRKSRSRNRDSSDDDDKGSRRASSRGIIPRAKVKTVKMTFVIVIVFIACWSPYIVFDLLQVFDQIPKTQTNIAVATFIQSLAPLNSAANPLIYCLFSAQVVKTLRWVFFLSSLLKRIRVNVPFFIPHFYIADEQRYFDGFPRHGVVVRRRKIHKINSQMGVYGVGQEIYIRITTQ